MLATTIATAILAQLPTAAQTPSELEGIQLDLVLQATENHFSAENRSAWPQVLLLGNSIDGTLAAVRVAPGERALYAFPRGSSVNLMFEVVSLRVDGWSNSGAIPFGLFSECEQRAVWIQGSSTRLLAWADKGQGIQHQQPLTCLVPDHVVMAYAGITDYSTHGMAHVPVPVPSPEKREGKPPVVNEEVLPPI